MAVPRPNIRWRGAHPNNFTVGRQGVARDGRESFHHVVGTRESAVIVFNNPSRGASSHFVVGGDIIDQCVDINNTAWCDGNWESNLRSITVEHEGGQNGNGPYSEEMYRNAIHLCAWLIENYGISKYVRHRDVSQKSTACPGGLDVERIWREAHALIKQYNQPVTPPQPEWLRNRHAITHKTVFAQKDGFFLVNMETMQPADTRRFGLNQDFLVASRTKVGNREFYITKSSTDLNIGNGIPVEQVADTPYVPPTVPQPIPEPPKPSQPDWSKSVVDTDNRPMYVVRATPLIDLENGHPVVKDGKEVWYQAGEKIDDVSAHTIINDKTYQLTEYSFQKNSEGRYDLVNGINSADLSVDPIATPPGTPHNPEPLPEDPEDPVEPMPDVPTPPTNGGTPVKDKEANVEAAKLVGRNGVLAAASAMITAFGNWALMSLMGLNLPNEVLISIGAFVYSLLLFIDKKIHENASKITGLVPF